MFCVYSLLHAAAIMVLFIPQYLKRPTEIRSRWLKEKLGILDEAFSMRPIWVHAVSVGEVNASLLLLKRLREFFPDAPLILSTITDTGQHVARQKSPLGTRVVYLPFDSALILNRCLRSVNPRALLVMETELWPNLFRCCAGRGIPVAVLNGRISERSARGYRRISFFMQRVLGAVSVFGMQGAEDAERMREIGAPAARVSVTGNFKFDMDMSSELPPWTAAFDGPKIVAGSTHRGEEELVVSAFLENSRRFPDLRLILAPRHPERFGEVAAMLDARGVPFLRRSQIQSLTTAEVAAGPRILLLDTIGELSAVYGIADIAVIGKSFEGTGGQNPLEAAYWGKPIICGPHMENFPFIDDFYRAGAAFEVETEGLPGKISELLLSPDRAREAGEKARRLYRENAGSVDRALDLVRGLLGS